MSEPKYHRGVADSGTYVEEMSRMLKVSGIADRAQEADLKLLDNSKQLDCYRKMAETMQRQNSELRQEKQRVLGQLQGLFTLYNKQKKTIEQLSTGRVDTESGVKIAQERAESLEAENTRLKAELNRELEQRNRKHKVFSPRTNHGGRTRARSWNARSPKRKSGSL